MQYDKFKERTVRGRILNEEAYTRGKMLDHAGWSDILPRLITPSDIDMVIDNAGRILFVEFSSKTCVWGHLARGQRLLYQNVVKAGGGKQTAALCHIKPEAGKQIDTVHDVIRFQVMYLKNGELEISPVMEGDKWVDAVKAILNI